MTSSRTRTKAAAAAAPETVDVVVVVSHGELRRGERGTVELTEVVRRRLRSGYLRLADTDQAGPRLGTTAAATGVEPRGVLLGVDGPPQVVMTSGGGGDGAGGPDHAAR